MKITVKDIMGKNPCREYSEERVTKLWNGRESLTLVDILDLDIPADDRIWAVSRFLPTKEVRLFAADCAESVLSIFETRCPGDDRPRN